MQSPGSSKGGRAASQLDAVGSISLSSSSSAQLLCSQIYTVQNHPISILLSALNVPETSLALAPHSDPGDFWSLPLESLRAQGVPSGEAVSPQAGTTSSSTGVADSSPASLALPGVHLGVLWLVVMEKSTQRHPGFGRSGVVPCGVTPSRGVQPHSSGGASSAGVTLTELISH